MQIKIENLQKVCTKYSDHKRQKTDGTDKSTTYNTADLHDKKEYQDWLLSKPAAMPTIAEQNKEPAAHKIIEIIEEEEFIPIGSRGKAD